MENLKNIQPVEDFNWDAFEQGETYTEVSKDDLVKTYDETLNTVKFFYGNLSDIFFLHKTG